MEADRPQNGDSAGDLYVKLIFILKFYTCKMTTRKLDTKYVLHAVLERVDVRVKARSVWTGAFPVVYVSKILRF